MLLCTFVVVTSAKVSHSRRPQIIINDILQNRRSQPPTQIIKKEKKLNCSRPKTYSSHKSKPATGAHRKAHAFHSKRDLFGLRNYLCTKPI